MPSKDKSKRGNPACVFPSMCSCAKCNSPFCTNSKKDLDNVCSCEDCTESRNCIFYSNRLIRVNNNRSQAEPCGVGDNKHSHFYKCVPNVHVDVSTSTFETLKTTIELCKSILEKPRSTIESLKNLYCKNKNDSNCCKDAIHTQTQSIPKQDKDCVCDYSDTPKDKSGGPNKQKVSKNSLLPQKDPSYWEEPINYRGRETPEYAFVLRKNIHERRKSLGCSEPSVLPEGLPPNISNPPGFIFDQHKLECTCEDKQKESSNHDSCQCSYSSPNNKCSCYNETLKQTAVHRVSLPGFVYEKKQKEKNELPKPNEMEKQIFVLQNPSEPMTDHRLSIPGYIYVREKQHDSKTKVNVLPQLDDQDFTYVLENVHDTFAQPEAPKISQTHRVSEPGFVYAKQKQDSKACCEKIPEGDKSEFKYVLQTPLGHPEGKQEIKMYGHRVSEPGFVYGLQKQSQNSKKNTCCGKIPEGDESEYKYVLQNAYDHKESKHETQKHTYPPKVSQTHRISEPGFVYALKKQKQDSKTNTCCGKIPEGDESEYKYVLQNAYDHPESKHETQKHTYSPKISQAHRISEPGYVYALQKQKRDSKIDTCCRKIPEGDKSAYKYVLQVPHDHPEGKHEMKTTSQAHRISEPGFVYALQKQNQDSKKYTCCGKIPAGDESDYKYVLQNVQDHPEDKYDIQKHTYPSEPSKMSQPHRISEPGFVYALQKQKQGSKKDTCCGKLSEDHPEIKHEMQKHTYAPKASQGHRISEPGNVYSLQQEKHDMKIDTCCGKILPKPKYETKTHPCNIPPKESLRSLSDPNIYTYVLQKSTHKLKKGTCCKGFNDLSEAEPPEYLFVLQKLPRQLADLGKSKHGSCSYHEGHKIKCEKHGCLIEILKHKHEASNEKNQKVCKHKLEKKKTETNTKGCECSQPAKDTPELLQLSPDQKKPGETGMDSIKLCTNIIKPPLEHKITCPCKSSTAVHSTSHVTSRSKCESHKHSHESRNNNLEICKNILEIQKNAIETLNSTLHLMQIKSCECNKVSDSSRTGYTCVPPKRSHESSKHSRDSSKHDFGKKPDNSCDQSESCCDPSKQSHQSSKDSTKRNSNDNSNSGQSDSCEKPHSLDLTKKKPEDISECPEDCCEPQTKHSHESMKKTLESTTTTLEYCCKLSNPSRTSIKHSKESTKNNVDLFTTLLQTQNNATDTLDKTLLGEKPCCNVSTTIPAASHGCILEQPIPKILPQISNFGCKECDKESSEAGRHELAKKNTEECYDVHRKHTNTSDSCSSDAPKKCEIPEYIFELHKYSQEPSNNNKKIWINRIEMLNNCNCNDSPQQEEHDTQIYCDCNESPKNKSVGYILELQKNAHESSKRAQDLLLKHKNKIKSLKHSNEKKCCDCRTVSEVTEGPGYIVDLQKNTQELCKRILEQQRNTIETLKNTINKKKDCDCNSKDLSDSGYIYEAQKDTQGAVSTRELCTSILEKQKKTIATLKSIHLLQQQICTCNEKLKKSRDPNKLQISKKTDELCESTVGSQPSMIDALKSMYLPSPIKTEIQSGTGKENQCCSATAMLSAEVMHLPYTDFTDPAYKPDYLPGKTKKLSKNDIFKRIKEAYEACSCKVCECIAGTTVQNDLCKCKPCECDDCISNLNKIVSKTREYQIKCHCNRCNNTGKCESTKRLPCSCLPCECEKCTRSLAKSCDCEPCQCIDCKSITIHQPQTLVVAPVEENVHRTACTCSPCDCTECRHAHPLTANVMHEMSTGTTRHAQCMCENCLNEACDESGLDSCKCEKRNRIMNKPVEKDTHDYDIRRVSIAQQNPFKGDGALYNRRYDTIAMFAALPKNYPHLNNDNKLNKMKSCICQKCECITCVGKEEVINAIKSSQLFFTNKSLSDLSASIKSKLNTPFNCECKICDIQKTDQCESYTPKLIKSCVCSICDCLNCEGDQRLRRSSNELCQFHSSSECTDCGTKVQKDLHTSEHRYLCSVCSTERCFGDIKLPNKIVQPNKRGKVLTTSTHKTKVHSLVLTKERLEVPSCSLKRASLNNYSSNKERNVSKYNTTLKTDNQKNLIQLFDKNHNTKNKNEISKYDTCLQSHERNKGKSILKNNSLENEISRSFLSGYSSFETSPKISCHKDDDITPISQNKNKSWESSCNSSGHDYPNYLMRFPKSAVETYLKDVMESDVDKATRLDKSNKVTNPASKKQCINNAKHQNGSGIELFLTQKFDLIDTSNSKLITIKQTKTKSRKTYEETINSQHYRDCIFELSNGLHLQTKKSNVEINDYYKINEEQVNDQNQINESENIKQLNNDNLEKSKYLQFLRNVNKVHVAHEVIDYNSKEQKASDTFPIQNKEYSTWVNTKPFSPSCFVGKIDILNNDDDNKRVQQTLKEAKEFSLELLRLLKMYEKANKEFEGISEKLKMSHDSICTGDFIEQKDTNSAKEDDILEKCERKEEHHTIIQNEQQKINLEAPFISEKITSTSVVTNSREIPERTFVECPSNNSTIAQKQGLTYLCKDISYIKKESEPIKEYQMDKSEPVLLHQIEAHSKNNNGYDDQAINENSTKNTAEIKNITLNGSSYETGTIPDNSKIKKNDQKLCKQYKKYSKLMKRTIIISKRICVKNSNANKPRAVIKYCISEGTSTPYASEELAKSKYQKTTLPSVNVSDKEDKKKETFQQIMNKLDTVFGSVEEVSRSTSTNAGVEGDVMLCNNLGNSELQITKPWPILKKNFSWNARPTKNKGVCIFPSLELQIKEAVQSISLQTSSTTATYPKMKSVILPHRENKALAKLQVEVKKLLDMPILQPETCASCRDCTNEVLNVTNKSKSNLELKEKPESLKRDDVKTVDDEVWCSFQKEDLQAQIRDLLFKTVLEPLLKNISLLSEDSSQYSKRPNIIPPKRSCDTFKVCFLGVRRISDHTMFVKWNVPRDLTCVRGYELLVDGRPVKKIFSPLKSLAVITCLPHADKVLLTVRTITSGVSLDGHYPAATIIYRPRHK